MSSAPLTARAVARAELTRAILDRARDQLGEVGPAALSVRAIARDLGMASSAVYRYFPSRDALLTALIIEGYDDLGAAVETADAGVGQPNRFDLRWQAICTAIREWARSQPHRYALLYGTPVPGYRAPDDTVAPARRITSRILGLIAEARAAGRHPVVTISLSAAERAAVDPIATSTEPALDTEAALRATIAYSALLGHISLELFGHFHRGVADYDTHFAHVVDQLGSDLGFHES